TNHHESCGLSYDQIGDDFSPTTIGQRRRSSPEPFSLYSELSALCLFFMHAFRAVVVSTLTTDHSIHNIEHNLDFQDMEEGVLKCWARRRTG
ncbi:MAG: hypothetical protein ABI988_16430, partial [Nitrospirota bacterium]